MMKKAYIILFCTMINCILFAQTDSAKVDNLQCVDGATVTKLMADSLYEAGLYEAAANTYEDVIATQGTSADVYYNLGNAYYKQDNIARAILNYERALLLNQGDSDVRANLALARGKTVDKVIPPSEMFFVSWWRGFANMVSVDFWAVVGVGSFILMLIGVLAYLYSTPLVVRKVGIYGALSLLFVVIISNVAANYQRNSIVKRNTAIIMSSVVTVKSSPNAVSTDLFLIHSGSKVEILDATMKEWVEIKLEEGKIGWIPVESMEVI